jgi:EAL domain-containing protein (putative c-di-GMP-specific phosphodiesterase class I)/GGDEF domain-containing protein
VTVLDGDVPEFLRAVGEQLRAASAQLVRTGSRAAITWNDCVQPGEGSNADFLEGIGLDWLASRATTDVVTVQFVDGWWVALAAVGAPSLPLDGVLLVTRGPTRPFVEADRELVSFGARVLSSLTGTAPLGSDSEWRSSGHRAGVGLSLLYDGIGSRLDGGQLSAYAVRLDSLPLVADVLGPGVAEEIIEVTRERMQEWAGSSRRVIQLAGADFLALRNDRPDNMSALHDADRLRHLLAQPVDVGNYRVARSVSVGVATTSGGSQSPAVLLASAFAAMREAQAGGGNTMRLYGEEHARRVAELRLELELQEAVRDNTLRLFYQPEFDLRTGALLAVEALLRWQHPERGLLIPDDFIEIAEASHSIGEIGEWVVRESFRQLAQWQSEFPPLALKLRLNVAAAQFADGGLTDLVVVELAKHGLRGEQVCVEITERSMPANLTDIVSALAGLRKAGVTSAIDDFGTGQSSFTHLRELPIDTIKVDRSFVTDLASDARSKGIVAAVMDLASALGLEVVAEGVESHETAAELIRLGCTRAQGNLLGAAMRAEQIRGLLQAGTARGL